MQKEEEDGILLNFCNIVLIASIALLDCYEDEVFTFAVRVTVLTFANEMSLLAWNCQRRGLVLSHSYSN